MNCVMLFSLMRSGLKGLLNIDSTEVISQVFLLVVSFQHGVMEFKLSFSATNVPQDRASSPATDNRYHHLGMLRRLDIKRSRAPDKRLVVCAE
ncbi:hypothetical protein WA026_016842 [Henosepilachna vigintioctopunctata]|uniref:Uncharacterized protein n=1 Tax=Henosepilachna vigintioctopunctata TaxID=420089 RepID=A0AAW1UA18_9CUCU